VSRVRVAGPSADLLRALQSADWSSWSNRRTNGSLAQAIIACRIDLTA